MPWKYNSAVIKAGSAWVGKDAVQHPRNWMSWSDEEKKAAGLTWEADPEPYDNRFYWGRDSDGKLIEKSLVDINEVDSDGKKILDSDGNQIVTKGLKTLHTEMTKKIANRLLSETDWYVIRKLEKATAIPSDISTFRDAVRTKCATIEKSISDAADMAAFQKLFDVPVNSKGEASGNAPINDWPDEVS